MLTGLALAVVMGALALVAAVEPGEPPPWRALLVLLGPAALAGGCAATLSIEQRAGRWAGWQTLGRDPRLLLLPMLIVASLGVTLQMVGSEPIAALPAPVAADVPAWWDATDQEWTAPPGPRWRTPPHELGPVDLVARARSDAPEGARRWVDHGELVRRLGSAAAWLLALLVSAQVAPAPRQTRRSVLGDGALAAGAVLGWQVLVTLGAAWTAAP